ncbi:Rib/alpha-like domain-containing protein (plasmid) [Clostridium perfringens]
MGKNNKRKKLMKSKPLILSFVLICELNIYNNLVYAANHGSEKNLNKISYRKLTSKDIENIHNGSLYLENGTLDILLLKKNFNDPNADNDNDGLKNYEEINIKIINGKEYINYISHPMLEDTDGDGISDNKDKEKLTWNISERDMILFQELCYRNDDYIDEVLTPNNESLTLYKGREEYRLMNNELSFYWKRIKSWHESNGFDAVLFEYSNKKIPFLNNESVHVLAIRGTEGNADYGSDASIFLGQWPSQANSAINLADEFDKFGINNVYVTGHSLGGFLGQVFLVRSLGGKYTHLNKYDKDKKNNNNIKELFTWNAPPIKRGAFSYWMGEYRDIGNVLTKEKFAKHYSVSNDSLIKPIGSFEGTIFVGNSERGHSSRSFFEDKFKNIPGFSVGNRYGLSSKGYIQNNLPFINFQSFKGYYNPLIKDQTVDQNSQPNAGDSIANKDDLPKGTNYEWKTPIDTTTPGEKDGVVVVKYPDGSSEEIPVKVTVKDDAEMNTPQGQDQTVDQNSQPNAGDSIANKDDLPKGTNYEWKTPIDTTTPGEKDGVVVVKYPDGSSEEIPVKVTVKDDAEMNTPQGQDQTVNKGDKPNAGDSIANKDDLPKGTNYEWKTPIDTTTPSEKDGVVVVKYPDGSSEEIPVKVTVKDDAEMNTPQGQDQTVDQNSQPNAGDSIANKDDLPKGTNYEWKTPIDTTTPGEKDGVVVVKYPDGSSEEIPVKVTVKDDAEMNTPQGQDQTVDQNSQPNAGDSIANKDDLPKGTNYEWKTPIDTTTPGEKDGVVVVKYPDGSSEEIPVKVTVKDDAEMNTPQGQDQTVDQNSQPNAGDSIANKDDLPKGTNYEWKTPIDTTTPGEKDGVVVVKYPDGSSEEIPVKVTVKDDAEMNTPQGQDQTVDQNSQPNAGDSIANKDDLPKGTNYEWKTPINTTTPGEKDGVVVVKYPDGSSEEIPVKVTVKDDAEMNTPQGQDQTVNKGDKPNAGDSIANKDDLPKGTNYEWKTPIDTTTPGEKDGVVVVKYPDGSSEEIPVKVTVKDDAEMNTPQGQDQTVDQNSQPNAGDSIANKDDLPKGTNYEWKTPIDTTTPGEKDGVVVVKYPDGSSEEIPVKVTVKDDAEMNTPQGQDQTVDQNSQPNAGDSIANKDDLPKGTNYEWKTPIDTTTPGEKDGVVVVKYPDGSSEEIPVKVTVKDDAEMNTPQGQDQTVDQNSQPNAGDSIANKDDLPKGTNYEWKTPIDTTTPGEKDGVVVVKYPDGSSEEIPVKVTVKDDAEMNTPQGQDQTVDQNSQPNAGDSIANKDDLPKGTNYEWKTPIDTTTPGEKDGVVVVKYPDGSSEEIPVKVTVKDDAEMNTPQGQDQTVDQNSQPNAGDSIANKDDLPKGTNYEWKTPIDTTTPGEKDGVVVVKYPDGSSEEIPVKVTVKDDAEMNTPQGQDQTVDQNSQPNAGDSIANKDDLPKGTNYEWKTPIDTTTPGEKDGVVVVKYPDGSSEEIPVKVTVKDDAEMNTPQGQDQTVNKGDKPNAGDSIANKDDLPKGTNYEWKTPIDTTTPGEKDGVVVVKYPDGSSEEIPVKVTVKDDAEMNTPQGQDQTVDQNSQPNAGDSIANKDDLPKGTNYEWKTPIDTTTPGEKDGVVVVKYPDGSSEEIPVKVTIKDDAEMNTPQGQDQTVDQNSQPNAGDSIANKDDLPKGTNYEWKTPIDTTTPGEKDGVVVVKYPDGSSEEIPVKVTVKDDAEMNTPQGQDQTVNKGDKPNAGDSIANKDDLPKGTNYEWKTPIDTTTPGEKDGVVVVKYPDGSSEEIPVKVTVKDDAEMNTPQGQDQTVDQNSQPNAGDSIANKDDLPKGTNYEWKTPIDTTTPGEKDGVVVVKYPDGSSEEIPVKVTVKDDAEMNTPQGQDQTVNKGDKPNAGDSIANKDDLPKGTNYEWKTPIDTTTPGEKGGVVVVKYPDGSSEEVPVKVTVTNPGTDADKYTPQVQDQTVNKGDKPNAGDSIANKDDLPKGTNYEWKTPIDTTTPGEKGGVVVVKYPDGSSEEVPVKVTVTNPGTDADKYTPQVQDQTVNKGDKPNAGDSIANKDDLPKGTNYEWKTPIDTTTPGEKDGVVVVKYPDGSSEEVPVKVIVGVTNPGTDADKYTPQVQDQTVNKGDKPNAGDSIANKDDLPKGTNYEWKTPIDTTTPGEKGGVVVVKYPDGSSEEVPVKVTVTNPGTDADKYTPQVQDQTVNKGDKPNAGDSIANKDDLPKGTNYEWKTPIDTTTPGEKGGVVVVKYPDGSSEEVPVKVTVTNPGTDADKYTPQVQDQTVNKGDKPNAGDSIANKDDLPKGTNYEWKTPIDTTTPGEKGGVVVVKYPDGSSEEVPVKVTVTNPGTDADKYTPQVQDQTVNKGDKPNAGDSIANKDDLPKGTNYEWKTPIDTTTPGEKDGVVVVKYPDGSSEEVPVKVTVTNPGTDADKYTPQVQDQTVNKGMLSLPKTGDSGVVGYLSLLMASIVGLFFNKKNKK